ncbi:MAG: hypothetical protein ABIE75_02110 [Candidatus Omnitrophota bacterium]
MINFLLLNLIVAFTSARIVRKVLYCSNLSDRICNFSLLFLAQIILTEMILGIFGKLFLGNLILINCFIFLIVSFILRNKKEILHSAGRRDFSWVVENKVVLFCLACILGFILVKGFLNLINPSFGWDSLNYHFTFPVEWLKHGNLYNPLTISDDPTPTYYPINNCLYYFWLIAPFKSVFIADLGQIPFLILSFIACFAIARKFNLSQELAFYSAGLFVITPNFFKQIEVGYADIMMTALLLTTLNLLFSLNKEFNLKYLVISGISFGLFFGTKTLCLAYSLALGLFFIYILVKNSKGLRLVGYGFLFLGLIALFGGYGYIRNFILSGNPLFPLKAVLLGKTIFKGVMPTATYLVRWTYEGYNLGKLFFHEGMGLQLLILIFPATFLAFPIILIRSKGVKLSFPLIYLSLLPAILLAIFTFIIPQLWTRFLYPYLAVGSVMAIYLLKTLKIPTKIIRAFVVICFLASIAEFSGYWELGFSLLAVVIFFLSLPLLIRRFKRRKARMAIIFSLLIILSLSFVIGQPWYLDHQYQRYISQASYWEGAMQAWQWLNDNTKAQRIAYIGRPVPFPLYGTGFKNDVYYVSVNNIHPAQLYLYPQGNLNWKEYRYDYIDRVLRRDENYRGKADFNCWYRNLIREDTDYLFVYILEEKYTPIEGLWAQAHSDKFQLVLNNPDAQVYKVIK